MKQAVVRAFNKAKETLKSLWGQALHYLNPEKTWANLKEMLEALDTEYFDPSFWTVFYKNNASRGAHDDNQNKCPYDTVEEFIRHMEKQGEWKAWRAAPLDKRRALARRMMVQFHPDK